MIEYVTSLSSGRIYVKVLSEMIAYNGYMQETECEKALGFDFINTYPYGFKMEMIITCTRIRLCQFRLIREISKHNI